MVLRYPHIHHIVTAHIVMCAVMAYVAMAGGVQIFTLEHRPQATYHGALDRAQAADVRA